MTIRNGVKCVVVECEAWSLYLYADRYLLMPSPRWMVRLVELILDGTISHAASQKVIEFWRLETMKKLTS